MCWVVGGGVVLLVVLCRCVDGGVVGVERAHVHEKDSSDEAKSLTVAHVSVEYGVGLEDVEEGGLAWS